VLLPAAGTAGYVIEQVSDSPWNCDTPAVACTPDGRTMIAWVVHEEGMWHFDFVRTLLLSTYASPGDPPGSPDQFGPGNRPALCWSRSGFTLAFASDISVLTYQSDLAGNFAHGVFDIHEPHNDAFGVRDIDLWGNDGGGAGPHIFMSIGGTLYLPSLQHEVFYTGCTELGWGDLELVFADPGTEGLSRISWETGPYGPWPRVYYLDGSAGTPSLYYRTKDLAGWLDPVLVPGEGGMIPGPVGSTFEVAAWDIANHAVLGNGLQPPCPCNILHYLEHTYPAGWSVYEDLTVNHTYYNWPLSPNLAVDPAYRVHAFWIQEGYYLDYELQQKNLEYWVQEGGVWSNQGAFLDHQDGLQLGGQVAMDVGPGGQPVFAWTRCDTIEGEPQPRAIWIARPEQLSAAPEGELPAVNLTLAASPNPFNPQVELSFSLPAPGPARLAVYDLQGRRIITLQEGALSEGAHRLFWGGDDARGRSVPAGAYICRLETPGGAVSERVTLLK
jgi:hypothetical protein